MSQFTREDFEHAARAAGYSIRFTSDGACFRDGPGWMGEWCPPDDAGDALRLSAKLQLDVHYLHGFKQVVARRAVDQNRHHLHGIVGYGNGCSKEPTEANVRKAIFLAAIALGKAMLHQVARKAS